MLKPIAEEVEFKPAFIERYSKLTDWAEFRKYSLSYLRKSIRVNSLKSSEKQVLSMMLDWNLNPVPWCKDGFFVEHKQGRLDIGNTIPHMMGFYFVQEAASMLPPIILAPEPGEVVLDLCASPGSKSSQLAALMENQGLLVANDISGDRLAALGMNLQRVGASNSLITIGKGERFKSPFQFDKILVDAPCSGIGAIRKSLKTVQMWNPGMIRRLAGLQKKILINAYSMLKPGGTITYSTCTLEPEEDEGVVSWFLDKTDAEIQKIKLPLKSSPPVTKFEKEEYSGVEHCLRLWPQDNDTEGFFVAKFVKPR